MNTNKILSHVLMNEQRWINNFKTNTYIFDNPSNQGFWFFPDSYKYYYHKYYVIKKNHLLVYM